MVQSDITSPIQCREWVGKSLAIFLMWVIVKMSEARRKRMNEKWNELVINTASDQSTMDSIVSAQQGLYTVHEMTQIANVTILKIWSILISKAHKVLPLTCHSCTLQLIILFDYESSVSVFYYKEIFCIIDVNHCF